MSTDPLTELQTLADKGLLRTLRPLDSPAGPVVIRNGRQLHQFSSNDYLGLASHPAIVQAFKEGIDRYGAGAAASRLVSGTLPSHLTLEEELAAAKRAEAALTFSSGYATSVGCIPAIVGPGDIVILDKLCHASLIDGARLSGATVRVFPHNQVEKLAHLLQKTRSASPAATILVVTESVFSMDGDLCPLAEIVALTEQSQALLFLDEAHGFGVLGERGMGLAEALGLQSRVTFQMGTFSKAAGLSGAYVASSRAWIELIINRARSFVFSTAPPPALAHAASVSLALIRSEEGTTLRRQLFANIAQLDPLAQSAIIPKVVGSNDAALKAALDLEASGLLVPAIRYPTVPRGTERLRISLSAAHSAETIASLAKQLGELLTPSTP